MATKSKKDYPNTWRPKSAGSEGPKKRTPAPKKKYITMAPAKKTVARKKK